MEGLKAFVEPFAWGFLVGYFWYPAWTIAKKIYSEAKYASENWKQK